MHFSQSEFVFIFKGVKTDLGSFSFSPHLQIFIYEVTVNFVRLGHDKHIWSP